MQNKINRLYSDLKGFEQELLTNFDLSRRDEYLKRLDVLEYQALTIQVSRRLASECYSLRTSIDYVRNCLNRGVQPYQINETSVELATQVLNKVDPLQTSEAEKAPETQQNPEVGQPPKPELLL
jgi:hypothetical protein